MKFQRTFYASGKVSVKGKSSESFSSQSPLNSHFNLITSLTHCLTINTLLISWPCMIIQIIALFFTFLFIATFLKYGVYTYNLSSVSYTSDSIICFYCSSNCACLVKVLPSPFLGISPDSPIFFFLSGHQWLLLSEMLALLGFKEVQWRKESLSTSGMRTTGNQNGGGP